MRVKVLDADTGNPINGLALDNCTGVKGNKTNFKMDWENGVFNNVAGRNIRLRFVLEDAAIYSFFFQAQ